MTAVAGTSAAITGTGLPVVDKAREVSKQFEAFFIGQLMDTMSKGIKTDGPFGGGQAEQAWRGMLNEEYGKVVANGRGFGLADAIYGQILRMQEAKPAAE